MLKQERNIGIGPYKSCNMKQFFQKSKSNAFFRMNIFKSTLVHTILYSNFYSQAYNYGP